MAMYLGFYHLIECPKDITNIYFMSNILSSSKNIKFDLAISLICFKYI